MSKEFPRIIVFTLLSLFVYNLVPILATLFPDTVAYYTLLLDTWIIVPLYVFVLGVVTSYICDLCAYLPVLVGITYIPTIILFYDWSLTPFVLVYVLLNFGGSLIGTIFYRKKIREEF